MALLSDFSISFYKMCKQHQLFGHLHSDIVSHFKFISYVCIIYIVYSYLQTIFPYIVVLILNETNRFIDEIKFHLNLFTEIKRMLCISIHRFSRIINIKQRYVYKRFHSSNTWDLFILLFPINQSICAY